MLKKDRRLFTWIRIVIDKPRDIKDIQNIAVICNHFIPLESEAIFFTNLIKFLLACTKVRLIDEGEGVAKVKG